MTAALTTALTTKLFFSLYFKSVDDFHSEGKVHATDCALMYLLKKHQYTLNQQNYIGDDPTGFSFHKGFRQKCISDENVARSIWFLLQDAPLFWAVLEAKKSLKPDPSKSLSDQIAFLKVAEK